MKRRLSQKTRQFLGYMPQKQSPVTEFRVIQKIGTGSFGNVYKVQHKLSKKIFCLKIVKKCFLRRSRKEHHIFIERLFLKKLKSSLVVELIKTFQDKDRIYFLLEYIPNGTLAQYLRKKEKLSEHETSKLIG